MQPRGHRGQVPVTRLHECRELADWCHGFAAWIWDRLSLYLCSTAVINTRTDPIALIASAVQRQLPYLDNPRAEAVADTVLRSMKAAGPRIWKVPPERE